MDEEMEAKPAFSEVNTELLAVAVDVRNNIFIYLFYYKIHIDFTLFNMTV